MGAYVCFIIGSALWVIAAVVHVLAAGAEISVLRTTLGVQSTPLLGRYELWGAWLKVLVTILVLCGCVSCDRVVQRGTDAVKYTSSLTCRCQWITTNVNVYRATEVRALRPFVPARHAGLPSSRGEDHN